MLMNKPLNTECGRIREQIMEWTLGNRTPTALPEATKVHLDRCPSCTLYVEGLGALAGVQSAEPLYTPALRTRTLARLASRPRRSMVLWLVPPALALNLFLSVALPAGLVRAALPAALGRSGIGLALSILAAGAIGAATVLICSAAMKTNALKEAHHA